MAERVRDVRIFGALLVVLSALVHRWAVRHGLPSTAGWTLTGVIAVVGVLAFAAPNRARPLYRAWMALGHLLGRVTTPVVLAIVFVLVFVPVRLLLRILGRDPLAVRFDLRAKSYWHERDRAAPRREDFERLT